MKKNHKDKINKRMTVEKRIVRLNRYVSVEAGMEQWVRAKKKRSMVGGKSTHGGGGERLPTQWIPSWRSDL